MKKITTRTAEIVLGDDGIVRKKMFDDLEIDIDDSIENCKAMLALTQNSPSLVLTDWRDIALRITREAREYYAGPEISQHRVAEALLINSMAARLTANFYLKVNKPVTPTRLFTDEQKAIEWLRTFPRTEE
jgi:hypothetical protein